MRDRYCLATTAISDSWDLDSKLLLLGPWCATGEKNKALLKNKNFIIVPSPWKPAVKPKEAADYCYDIYEKLLPQLCVSLNSIHQVSYPVRYWRILIGHWLLHFIGVFYDRYKRIEKALELFPDFYTYVLPHDQCKLISYNAYDFLTYKAHEEYYNLKLFGLIAYELCPHNIIEKYFKSESKIYTRRYNWKRRLLNRAIKALPLGSFSKGSIVLADMYHLTRPDMFFIKCKTGFKTVRFIDFGIAEEKFLKDRCPCEVRKKMKLTKTCDRFQSLLCKVLPEAIPMCYIENYKFYRKSIKNIRDIESIRIVGSAVGWYYNERFKFFAAEAVLKGAKLIEFQHGGGYGLSLINPHESLSLERDIFYTWGWDSTKIDKIKPLPNPHLSRLKDTHSPQLDNILFAGTIMPRYHYRFQTILMPDDMPKYLEDKSIFFQTLPVEIRNMILYRPYPHDYGWEEKEKVKKICPNVHLALKGKLVDWMKKVKLVVIDHRHTSFIEALSINVPCIFYWDHDVFLNRPESEEYFELLRKAGILYKDPKEAAAKLKEVFKNPSIWWRSKEVQNARNVFLERFGYSRKNWMDYWVKEIKQLESNNAKAR